ncbi:MAG: D-hexose-6-phosphate mutarotase [Alphaproteobacteria bacterium]|jgi:D-hexose-6-phosphate mutarotase|nr:D-hexose-6-phosphate mutarotase [Alphaproteobacteria bacterium]
MTFPLKILATAAGQVQFTPYGAQVLSYVPTGQREVLWQNTPELLAAAYAAGKPLRAGIPLCWPWFMAHPTDPAAPSHGFARIKPWELVAQQQTPERAQATLVLTADGQHRAFPFQARAEVTITLTDFLHVALTTANLSDRAMPLTQALHTYVQVGALAHTTLVGLEGLPRVHITPNQPVPPQAEPLRIQGETELRYSNVAGPVVVQDQRWQRCIEVVNQGCSEVVVWNPGPEKALKLDIPLGGEAHFVCVEAATIQPPLQLPPGGEFTLSTALRVRPSAA